MVCFKGVLIGFSTVLLGCLVSPIALMIWASYIDRIGNFVWGPKKSKGDSDE
jgi:hypothetical protein